MYLTDEMLFFLFFSFLDGLLSSLKNIIIQNY